MSIKTNQTILALVTFLFIQLICPQSKAQNQQFITGRIINKETNAAIPFVTIALYPSNMGVISNANGDFKLGIQSEYQTDTVVITCIGFKSQKLLYKQLSTSDVNTIFLSPAVYNIDEVMVLAKKKRLSSLQIIKRAIERIEMNYPCTPFSYTSYFRDYQTYKQRMYNMNEAIIHVSDSGFNTSFLESKFRLLDFKQNPNFPKMDVTPFYDTLKIDNPTDIFKTIPKAHIYDKTGNELIILLVHDAIRNYDTFSFSFVDTLKDNFIVNHHFDKKELVTYNNIALYKINFKNTKYTNDAMFEVMGDIYIQPKIYAIYKFEYTCFLLKKDEKQPLYKILTEYDLDKDNHSMRLKYISFNNLFEIPDPDESSIFKVIKSHWNYSTPTKSVLTIEFNKAPDPLSSDRKRNYSILIDGEEVAIKEIETKGRSVKVTLRKVINNPLTKNATLQLENITDVGGNLINERKKVQIYQFREMFVQSYNKPIQFTDNNYIKALPLEQNAISKPKTPQNFWMNTPVQSK